MALRLFWWRTRSGSGGRARHLRPRKASATSYEPAPPEPLADDMIAQCLQTRRFGMVVSNRERWAQRADVDGAIAEASRQLRQRFAAVPEGFATLPESVREIPGSPEVDVDVQAFRLAVHPVTNAEYQFFVDAGGYSELELWPRDLWPQLPGFVDSSGCQAPRHWREGRHDRRRANHPVVGVCYYEAAAYARWAGYRLPTEAEWQMAASWRLRSLAHLPRRFPWGDALDTRRCNVWATGIGDTAPVDAYPDGAAPNGVQQLIGNVWEWTSSDYEVTDDYGSPVVGDMPMKSVRGGAFDTYFPAQAASTFRTGLAALVRANNVGFRCAVDSDFVAEPAAVGESLRERM